MIIRKRLLLLFLFLCLSISHSYAQGEVDYAPVLDFREGLGVLAKDSLYMINFRFRMQNRAEMYTTNAQDLSLGEVDARVRRLRLRIDGFLLNPKFSYYIQLSFSRGDQDFEDLGVPNIVRDAMLFYYPRKNLFFGFGQGKLPGNRQRVISSGQQQFAERSIVNAFFNIDRDFGFFGYYLFSTGPMHYRLSGAISTGEGRNAMVTNNGLAYTGKIEWLPLGEFLRLGDYSEGDLERHPQPRISFGLALHQNQGAVRTRGQTGAFLFEERNLHSLSADMIFKYRGLASYAEYIRRDTDNPLTFQGPPTLPESAISYVFAGHGFNNQWSYLFKNNYEIAFRYAWVNFQDELENFQPNQETISLGGTKYLRGHRVKIQSNLTYWIKESTYSLQNPLNRWSCMFQVELGI